MSPILRGGTAENRCVVVFQLLGVDGSALGEALTHKKLTAKGEEVTLPPSCLSTFSLFVLVDCGFIMLCSICICRWSVCSILSRRCLPATPWPRPCTVERSLGWWRRSTSPWPQRCNQLLPKTQKQM